MIPPTIIRTNLKTNYRPKMRLEGRVSTCWFGQFPSTVLLACSVAALSSCASLKPGYVTGTAKPPEQIRLTVEKKSRPESLAFLGVLGVDSLGDAAIKLLASAGSKYLEDLADKFEAKYLDKQNIDHRAGGQFSDIYEARFERILKFNTIDERIAFETQWGFSDPIEGEPTATRVLDYRFEIRPSTDGKSIQAIPNEIVYNAPKARSLKVPATDKDQIQLVMLVEVKHAYSDSVSSQIVSRTDAAQAGYKLGSKASATDLKRKASDWMPAPMGPFTLQVTAMESSDAPKWIRKAAEKVKKLGED